MLFDNPVPPDTELGAHALPTAPPAPLVDLETSGAPVTHDGLGEGERAITVEPNVWTVAHVDADAHNVVQVFHANAKPIDLAVGLNGAGRFIGLDYPPDGWRVRNVPFIDSGVPSLIDLTMQRDTAELADGQHAVPERLGENDHAAFRSINVGTMAPPSPVDNHPLNHGR